MQTHIHSYWQLLLFMANIYIQILCISATRPATPTSSPFHGAVCIDLSGVCRLCQPI